MMKITRRQLRKLVLNEFKTIDPENPTEFDFTNQEEEEERRQIHLFACLKKMRIVQPDFSVSELQPFTFYVNDPGYLYRIANAKDVATMKSIFNEFHGFGGLTLYVPDAPYSELEKKIIKNKVCADKTDVIIHYHDTDYVTNNVYLFAGSQDGMSGPFAEFYYSPSEVESQTIRCD